MHDGLIFLFLFAALAIGWLLGLLMGEKQKPSNKVDSGDSFAGSKHRLQLLFDSYNDASLDSFIDSLEVKPDTVALHISIGKHFRTQGEVEKAILIHQNLMSHPELTDSHTEPVIYELAKDYKAAGLFDRCESLLEQLLPSKSFGFKSRVLLLDIYEQEKDWQKAYELTAKLDVKKDEKMKVRVAQYCCEIAEEYLQEKRQIEASKMFAKALNVDKKSVRAMLALADLDIQQDNIRSAISRLRELLDIAPEFSELALPRLFECSEKSDTFAQYEAFLRVHYEKTKNIPTAIALFEVVFERDGDEALEILEAILKDKPDMHTLKVLIATAERRGNSITENVWEMLKGAVEKLTSNSPAYLCGHCGFSGQHLYWRCPSCRNWQSIRPYQSEISGRAQRH